MLASTLSFIHNIVVAKPTMLVNGGPYSQTPCNIDLSHQKVVLLGSLVNA